VEETLMARESILHRIRTGLGRGALQAAPEPPPVRIRIPETDLETRVSRFLERVEELAGSGHRVSTPADARAFVERAIEGGSAVASNAPYLAECGIPGLAGVRSSITDREELRGLCASADFGITSADFALADTGTLVLLSSPAEARLISLLPPAHIAVVPRERILSGLDELFSLVPRPADLHSSMVLITGPSRTADIEQILVRGVHGPGKLTVLVTG
jgi:L-lactate dehydrogenase complex protein LldG